jgi:hypothetical protein
MKNKHNSEILNKLYDKLLDNSQPLDIEQMENPILDEDDYEISFEYQGKLVTLSVSIVGLIRE